MMRSMFSAVSGLSAHQLRMDSIGNNIANVNTVGFKANRTTFQDVFNQTLAGAGSPQGGRGGTNPQQVGLGMTVNSMDTLHVRGAVETTGVNTDMMINGDGFFMVSSDPNFQDRSYTRAGDFALDRSGNLVTPGGMRVLGYMADENGVLGTNLEGLVISRAQTFDAEETDNVGFEGNLDSTTKVAVDEDGNEIPLDDIFDENFRIIPGQEQYVARETTFEIFDNLGGEHRIKQVFVKAEQEEIDGENHSVFDVLTFYVGDDGTLYPFTDPDDPLNPDPDALGLPASHKIYFNEDGKMVNEDGSFTKNLSIAEGATNGAGQLDFTVNFSKLTMFANESTAAALDIDGYKQGSLVDFSVASSGEITGVFDNGQSRVIGQVALANFRNPAGLEKDGSNMYRSTNNSGQAMIGTPGSGGLGALNPSALEMSNTDLSREFTNMITTQRGFQANSRIITTSDEMLQEVVNMKR
ncbi:flagellar hook protein FlgE [Tindallia californiensis]|uniref:Flagellar hook protein FlgE n=1 Tax=Tindallia californiensis TaxID=159292 RepID=A0A1H3NRZ9_9FIRM|nr:flagellar hook protein FlgE [Tindallia californiensis]SDY91568.1 flagellar hook protein FlgE [Tindallia californiensis]